MAEYSDKEIENGKKAIAQFILNTSNKYGKYIIFLAAGGMFLDAWNFAAFSAAAFAFTGEFHPSASALGLAVGIINGGAAIGAITGGYLTDKIGRKAMFMINMLIFVLFAFLAAISANVLEFTVFRFILGFALGADVATGFSYIFEFASHEQRKSYYSVWAYLWSTTYVVANLLVLLLLTLIGPNLIIWRIVVGISAPLALIILILRTLIPESALWLAHVGKLKSAKEVIRKAYNVDLNEVPDIDIESKKTTISDFINVFKIGLNRVFGYAETLNILLSFSFWGFSFYIPIMLGILKFGTHTLIAIFSIFIYFPGLIAAIIAPFLIKKFGDKKINIISGFAVSLSLILIYLVMIHIFPLIYFLLFSMIFIFFLFLGPFSYNSIINFGYPSAYRGIINGWNYMISKIIAFVSGFLGAYFISLIGIKGNTIFLFILDLICSILLIFLAVDITVKPSLEAELKTL
jgi:MFS family permease